MFADHRDIPHRMAGPRHRTRKVYSYALPVLLLPAGALLVASGGSRWEKTFESIPNPRISVVNPGGGAVIVRGWDQLRVHAVCLTGSSKIEVDCDQTPAAGEIEKLHFVTHALDSRVSGDEGAATYELDIPNGATLDVNNPQGNVTVQGLSGEAWIESVMGKISVIDSGGRVNARSLNGDIELVRPSGRIEATSVMGNLRFIASTSPMVRAQATGSGNIVFDGEFVPGGDYALVSYQGNMDITCPRSDSFKLQARTVRGKVDDQLRLSWKGHSSVPPGQGGIGFNRQGGDAWVDVRSYSGTIHVRPRF